MRNRLSRRGFGLTCEGAILTLVFTVTGAVGEEPAAECARIESAAERLTCYDEAFGAETGAAQRSTEELVDASAAPAAAAATTDEADFGLIKPKSETEVESLTSAISGLSRDAYKRRIFELENGQVWRQIEYKSVSVDVGDVAVIRRGSFSSYKLYIDGTKNWTRVRRVE